MGLSSETTRVGGLMMGNSVSAHPPTLKKQKPCISNSVIKSDIHNKTIFFRLFYPQQEKG